MEGFKIKKIWIIPAFLGIILIVGWLLFYNNSNNNTIMEHVKESEIKLPDPQKTGQISVEEALAERRSIRDYKDEPLSLEEISQLLWAAQGITAPDFGGRTAPSAGSTYPLEVYLVVRKAEIDPGLYKYLPDEHKLVMVLEKDVSYQLAEAALGQAFIAKAPVNLVFSAVFERTSRSYGDRGAQYVYMEAGHAAQNVYLQAQSLGLGTVVVGAFGDEEVRELLNLSEKEAPLYIIPVGRVQ